MRCHLIKWTAAVPCVLLMMSAGIDFTVASGLDREIPAPTQAPNEHEADPGGEITSDIRFQNLTPDTLPLQIEMSDFVPGEDGKIVVDQTPDASRSLKAWMELLTTSATVRPGEELAIEYAIHVPKDAAPGSRWAAIRMTTPPVESVSGERHRFNLSAVVLVRVLGDAKEHLAVGHMSVARPDSAGNGAEVRQVLNVRFVNEGDVHLKPAGAVVEVFSFFGKRAARVALPEQNVLPGYARIISAELPAPLRPGLYWARLEGGYGAKDGRLSALRLLWIAPSVIGSLASASRSLLSLAWFGSLSCGDCGRRLQNETNKKPRWLRLF